MLSDLENNGMEQLLLDLRNNGGGMMDQAISEMLKTDQVPQSEKSNREYAISILGNVVSPGHTNAQGTTE